MANDYDVAISVQVARVHWDPTARVHFQADHMAEVYTLKRWSYIEYTLRLYWKWPKDCISETRTAILRQIARELVLKGEPIRDVVEKFLRTEPRSPLSPLWKVEEDFFLVVPSMRGTLIDLSLIHI